MSSIRYIIQTGLFCQDPDYLVWIPEDPLDDSTAWMITSQKRHTDFLCPYCVKPMHVYSAYRTHSMTVSMQPNARCTVLSRDTASGVLAVRNGYGTQSVQMSWNENRKRASV